VCQDLPQSKWQAFACQTSAKSGRLLGTPHLQETNLITIDTTIALIVVAVCFLAIPTILMLCIKNKRALLVATCVLTAIFFVGLCICVFSQVTITPDNVTIEIISNGKWCAKSIDYSFKVNKQDLLINLFMLFPMGAFCIVFTQHRNLKFPILWGLMIGLIIGFLIETFQFILPVNRSVQLSDMVLNAASVVIGTIYYWVIGALRKRIYKNY